MLSQVKSFTTDIESRLERAYSKGASNKFGFASVTDASLTGSRQSSTERQLKALEKEATEFLKKQEIRMSNQAKPAKK